MYPEKVERRLRPIFDAIECHQYKVGWDWMGLRDQRGSVFHRVVPHASIPLTLLLLCVQQGIKLAEQAEKKLGYNQMVQVLKSYSLIGSGSRDEGLKVWAAVWSHVRQSPNEVHHSAWISVAPLRSSSRMSFDEDQRALECSPSWSTASRMLTGSYGLIPFIACSMVLKIVIDSQLRP